VSELRNESETIEHLHQLKRIRMLLRMMEWPGQPAELNGALYLSSENRPNTRYMKLDEFNKKHVLPTPEIFPILAHPRENRDG
jgi:hypothetical protein